MAGKYRKDSSDLIMWSLSFAEGIAGRGLHSQTVNLSAHAGIEFMSTEIFHGYRHRKLPPTLMQSCKGEESKSRLGGKISQRQSWIHRPQRCQSPLGKASCIELCCTFFQNMCRHCCTTQAVSLAARDSSIVVFTIVTGGWKCLWLTMIKSRHPSFRPFGCCHNAAPLTGSKGIHAPASLTNHQFKTSQDKPLLALGNALISAIAATI